MRIKNNFGLIFSVLLHLFLLLLAFFIFDRDRYDMKQYQKTQTKGYTVQLMKAPDSTSPPQSQAISPNSTSKDSLVTNHEEDINLKNTSKDKGKIKKLAAKKAKEKSKLANSGDKGNAIYKTKTIGDTKVPDQAKGDQIEKLHKEVIVQASAPIVDYSKEGSGDRIDASTDGTGNQSSVFDLRRVEYGRAVAAAIRQNIVPPPGYNGTVLPYRAYVILDENMQFVKMEVVQSTGDQQFDINIAKALRQTIYPPLPDGADWRYYHNIDFTIHQE